MGGARRDSGQVSSLFSSRLLCLVKHLFVIKDFVLSAPPLSDSSTRLAAAGVSHSPSSDRDVSHDALVQPPLCSKALQTDEDMPPQQVTFDDLNMMVFYVVYVI